MKLSFLCCLCVCILLSWHHNSKKTYIFMENFNNNNNSNNNNNGKYNNCFRSILWSWTLLLLLVTQWNSLYQITISVMCKLNILQYWAFIIDLHRVCTVLKSPWILRLSKLEKSLNLIKFQKPLEKYLNLFPVLVLWKLFRWSLNFEEKRL